jgi:TAT (twin-arginine translocation) pathway-exported protein
MVSRRDFLKALGAGAAAFLLQGCTREDVFGPVIPSPMYLPTLTPHTPGTPTAVSTSTHPATPPSTHSPTLATSPTATSSPTLTPDPRKLCFVLWDHQLARYGYRPRNLKVPLPETCPLRSGATNHLTPAWIDYWRGILRVCNPMMGEADFEASWNSLIADNRAFTNNSGPESGNFGLHSLTCGGATHQMVTGVPEGPDGRYMRIYTFNIHNPPPPIPNSPKDMNITRHFLATTGSNIRLPDGSYAVFGFPQFENTIIPLVSPEDTDLIEVSRIKVVTNIQRPYNTPPESTPTPTLSLSPTSTLGTPASSPSPTP